MAKPDGEACREDGTLKDASELEWPNSPSELESSTAKYDSEWDERMKNSWKVSRIAQVCCKFSPIAQCRIKQAACVIPMKIPLT